MEQPGKSALFPEKGAKLTTGKHESIFLEEVHFFCVVFPKKVHFFQKDFFEFWFLEQPLDALDRDLKEGRVGQEHSLSVLNLASVV